MGSPSAIDDILNNPRFQGAINSIHGVTAFCDSFFVAFISFVAFFIISAALLRNVIAGAYASYPKLFDWVAEAKQAGIDKVSSSRVGPIAGFFLRLIPDFKNLSDFHDDTVEPKHYFMKSIPQMIGVVMIGVVIYNGYYRDAVAITAGFGSELISRVLLTVDPVAIFDKIANSSGNPTFAHDSDTTPKGKLIESLSTDIYSKVVSFYTDINGEQAKSALGATIEHWITTEVEKIGPEYLIDGSYSIEKQVTRVLGSPDLTSLNGTDPADGLIHTFATSLNIKDLNFSTTTHVGEDWWLRIVIRFTKEAQSAPQSGSSQDITLSIGNFTVGNGVSIVQVGSDVIVSLPTGTNAKFSSPATGIKVKLGSTTYSGSTDGTNLTIKNASVSSLESSTLSVSGLSYISGSSQDAIKQLNLGVGIDASFRDNTGNLADFKWGDTPVKGSSGVPAATSSP